MDAFLPPRNQQERSCDRIVLRPSTSSGRAGREAQLVGPANCVAQCAGGFSKEDVRWARMVRRRVALPAVELNAIGLPIEIPNAFMGEQLWLHRVEHWLDSDLMRSHPSSSPLICLSLGAGFHLRALNPSNSFYLPSMIPLLRELKAHSLSATDPPGSDSQAGMTCQEVTAPYPPNAVCQPLHTPWLSATLDR